MVSPGTGSLLTDASEVLRRVFGYDSFRDQQQEIIEHVAAGGDALVLMPTGGGKSLCYQIPALLRPGAGVVVSPLIALMQDQVDALLALGAARRFPQLDAGPRRAPAGRGGVRRRRARPAVPGAGAAADRLDDAPARPRPHRPVRDRRGALRVPVGARLPARLPRAVRAARALARRAADRADRDRHPGHQGRDRGPAEPGRGAPVRVQLRPAEHPLPDRRPRPSPGGSCWSCCGPSTPGTRASCTACPGPRSSRRPSS